MGAIPKCKAAGIVTKAAATASTFSRGKRATAIITAARSGLDGPLVKTALDLSVVGVVATRRVSLYQDRLCRASLVQGGKAFYNLYLECPAALIYVFSPARMP